VAPLRDMKPIPPEDFEPKLPLILMEGEAAPFM
jgi:hypothetical protein